eukprot:4649218-Pyramimonas_sp.AAC.1
MMDISRAAFWTAYAVRPSARGEMIVVELQLGLRARTGRKRGGSSSRGRYSVLHSILQLARHRRREHIPGGIREHTAVEGVRPQGEVGPLGRLAEEVRPRGEVGPLGRLAE